jgi:predicted TIM-barrel fold metal-dependent hydrolase
MPTKTNRREFFKGTAATTAGLLLGNTLMGYSANSKTAISPYNIMEEVKKYRKIDCHIHVNLYNPSSPEQLIDYADRMGIEKLVISRPVTEGEGKPEQFIGYNNMVLDMMKKYPGRVLGQLTVNPIYQKESFEEIKRCIDMGMVALKLYHQVKINDPLLFPIIEKFIDLKMIILMHAECQLGIGGYRMKYDQKVRPNVSTPEDFVDAAKRYPEAMFQFAHIGGGGDWEYECKMIKDFPNIYVDTSGSKMRRT